MTEAAKQSAMAKQAAMEKQAAAKQAPKAKQAAAKQAKSATPAALAGSPCLNKGYNKGTVIFRDSCTGEWAQREPNTRDTRASGN
jgi:hypothetical protein